MSIPRQAFLAVVYILGLALLLCIVGIVVLALAHEPIPDPLKEIAIAALPGLTGMLVHPGDATPTPVVVQQPDDQPVPVTPTDDQLDDPGPTFPAKTSRRRT